MTDLDETVLTVSAIRKALAIFANDAPKAHQPWPLARPDYDFMVETFGERAKRWYVPVETIGDDSFV